MNSQDNGIDQEWHKRQVEDFKAVRCDYETYSKVLTEILEKAKKQYDPLAIVQSRVKTIPSFAEKAVRKAHKYKEPVKQITDLCGARIITHFEYQVEQICTFIREHFEIDDANSLDVRSRLRVSEFGYMGVHYIVTPATDEIAGIKIPEEIKDKKAEIQIKTLLQHTWADITHDRIYKTSIDVPQKWVREVSRLAAMMESADDSFAATAEVLDYYSENYGTMLSENNLKQEIEFIETIFNNETDATKKSEHALRWARLEMARCNWGKVIQLLEPYAKKNGQSKEEAFIELGRARCQQYKDTPSNPEYLKGQALLRSVAKPDQPVVKTDPYSRQMYGDSVKQKLRAKALYLLGCSISRDGRKKHEAKDLLYKAHQLDPSNPYYFAEFVEYVAYCSKDDSYVSLLGPSIEETIENCREHIGMGIEQAQAYFTVGRMYLILDDIYQSLNAYTKAIDLCISQKTCIPHEVFDEELEALKRLNRGKPKLPRKLEWVEDLLLLARVIKYQDLKARKTLTKRRIRQKAFREPVTVIAGGAEDMPRVRIHEYQDFLNRALQSYEGTILAGGTTSGVPGLVGTATQTARRAKNGKFDLIGYLPKILPEDAAKDQLYDEIVETPGSGFTVHELIQYWIDLVIGGVDPSNIIMLGINGGRISDMEYKIALAMGARVGLVESSGRAATELMLDSDWSDQERILLIPDDALTVWAFINQACPSPLQDNTIEEAAQKVHQYYLVKKTKDRDTDDPSMLPWDRLPESLKESNRQQVRFMERVLKNVGYAIRSSEAPVVKKLKRDLIIRMAEMEHARWIIERLNDGWTYGPKKDIEKKISPFLVPWNELTDKVKDWDKNAVSKFPEVLADAGFEVY